MDTQTVLEIIKMIDYRITESIKASHIDEPYFTGKIDAYEELSHHLQSFIEGQLSSAENSTGE